MTVLLVDDDPAILVVMKMRLEQRGYRVAIANSALAAERVAIREQPELALVDVIMPGINGVELCRRLTHSPDLPPQLRVVMWSSINDLPIIEAATRAGASGYIIKSSDLNVMLAEVLRWLEAPADAAAANVLHPLLFNKGERRPPLRNSPLTHYSPRLPHAAHHRRAAGYAHRPVLRHQG